MTFEQLRRWLRFSEDLKNERTARTVSDRSVAYLRKEGLLKKIGVKIEKTIKPEDEDKKVASVQLTEAGKQVLEDLNLVPRGMSLFSVPENDSNHHAHDFKLTEIRFVWECLVNRVQWYSERLFRGWENNHFPDAHVTFFSNKRQEQFSLALELEETAKGWERYEAKFKAYAKDPKYDNILYFSANGRITQLITEISKGITDKIFVCQTDEFLKFGATTRFSSHNDHFKFNERVNCVTRK